MNIKRTALLSIAVVVLITSIVLLINEAHRDYSDKEDTAYLNWYDGRQLQGAEV